MNYREATSHNNEGLVRVGFYMYDLAGGYLLVLGLGPGVYPFEMQGVRFWIRAWAPAFSGLGFGLWFRGKLGSSGCSRAFKSA